MKERKMSVLEEKIQAYLNGHLSDVEKSELESWINSSQENQEQFDRYRKIYDLSEVQSQKFCPNVDVAWRCVESKISANKSFRINPTIYRIAAVLVLAIGLGFFAASYFSPTKLMVARTGKGELQRVNLSDGSTVILNENSVFKFPKNFEESGYRKVYLFGHGFFEIAKDENRPFKIVGSSTTTEVLGTSFDLKSYKKNSQVNVVTGKVLFRDKNNSERVVLEKGYSAQSTNRGTVVRHEIDERMMAWRYGELDFKSEPLKEVAKVLSKHYRVKIKLNDGIENCLITSKFQNKTLDEILQILNVIANIESEKDDKGVVRLSGPSC